MALRIPKPYHAIKTATKTIEQARMAAFEVWLEMQKKPSGDFRNQCRAKAADSWRQAKAAHHGLGRVLEQHKLWVQSQDADLKRDLASIQQQADEALHDCERLSREVEAACAA